MEVTSPFPDKIRPVPKAAIHEYVLEKVQQRLDKNGDQIFVRDISTGETLLFSEVEPLSRKVASALARKGFKEHDYCLMVTRNHCRVFICFLAVLRLNGTLFLCYPEDNAATLTARLKLCKCRFAFCDSESAPEVLQAFQMVDWKADVFSMDTAAGCVTLDELLLDDTKAFPLDVSVNPAEDAAVVFCTSGTTGISKGACHCHYSILCFLVQEGFFSRCQGYAFATGKPFHVSGFLITLGFTIRSCSMLLASKVTPEEFFKTIHTYKPETIFSFPTYLGWAINHPSAHKYDFSSVTIIMTGGAPTFPSQVVALRKTFPNLRVVNKVYGMTESLMLTTIYNLNTEPNEEYRTYLDTSNDCEGYMVPYAKGKVVDIDTKEALGVNQPGEICLSAPTMMKEYLGQPKETAETLEGEWIYTGDYGFFDFEGGIHVLSRLKEVFKYWNYHISPLELEAVILQHPDVSEVCVFGVKDPEGGGDIPRAIVVLKPGLDSADCSSSIKEFVSARVEKYKQLRGGIIFTDELPRGNTGKVKRVEIAQKFAD